MRRRSEWRRWCGGAALAGLAAALSGGARPAHAQTGTFLERLNLDRLQLAALGVAGGAVRPAQLEPSSVYEVHADYGAIAERWHIVFTASFWQSRYQDHVVQAFADSIERSTDPPSEVVPSRVTVSDIALGAEGRWHPRPSSFLRPYLGLGLAAHVINTEGRLIDGTFVENALDYITAGVSGTAGMDMQLLENVRVGAQARYDLLSGIRFGSLRLTATYVFDPTPTRGGATPAEAP